MTYYNVRNITFIETNVFTNFIDRYLTDEEYSELQQYIAMYPESGKIISGGNGIRKICWSRKGMGKSGGIRIIYYWAKTQNEIYMLTAYSKSEKENIDKKTLAQIAKSLESLK